MVDPTPVGSEWGGDTRQAPGGTTTINDAQEMRDRFAIPRLEVDEFRPPKARHKGCIVYPDMLIHEMDPDRTPSAKGTDCLIKGDRDSGKTTLARTLAVRLMNQNNEKVIWRGRRGGSGWLPYRDYTTLWLPAQVGMSGEWMPDGEDMKTASGTAVSRLDDVVRKVRYYDGIEDLLNKFAEEPGGSFHVMYPDPLFRDCERVTRLTDRGQFAGGLEFTPVTEAGDDEPATPITDWWAAFLVARAEHGPFDHWTTFLCDEAGDLYPQNARNDDNRPLYDLISMLRGVWATSRKRKLSLFFFCHYEENLHEKLRREFKWRIHMPDESSNPVRQRMETHPVGFKNDIKMYTDIMSHHGPGIGLCYTKGGYTKFRWPDVSAEGEDAKRWLSISPRTDFQDVRGGGFTVETGKTGPENTGSAGGRERPKLNGKVRDKRGDADG